MPLAKITSGAVVGLDPVPIEVEVNIESSGFPAFNIVGLPDKAVEEAKERVRSALKNSGADFPQKRITVNLAPADLPKAGPSYDLPIALGILLASEQLGADLSDSLIFGELSLDGSVRPVPGSFPLTILAREKNYKRVFLPEKNAKEAALIPGIEVYPIPSLKNLVNFILKLEVIVPHPQLSFEELLVEGGEAEFDFADVRGQEHVKRVLEVAAAGGHNVSMTGPPGAGKTMLARTIPSILPKLTPEEAFEVTKIYSVLGKLPAESPLVKTRPFRSPHHTSSSIGLIGGGTHPQPGEISLAHRGVLFLDEFPELPRHVLEALRQPLEDGFVSVSRAAGSVIFPAKFMLIAASNPCPCGFFGDPKHHCVCSTAQILRYRHRVSGPIWDRIDLHVEVPAVAVDKLTSEEKSVEDSKAVRARVQAARDRQSERFKGKKVTCNAEMSTKDIKELCSLSPECLNLMRQAVSQLNLSARAYYRVARVARTIADIGGEQEIKPNHLAEAIQYRARAEDL